MITKQDIVNLAHNQLSEAQFLLLSVIPEELSQKLFDLVTSINQFKVDETPTLLVPGVVNLILRYYKLDFFEFRQWHNAKGKELDNNCFYNKDVSEYIAEQIQ